MTTLATHLPAAAHGTSRPSGGWLRGLLSGVTTGLLLAAVALAAAVVVVPRALGGTALTVLTGSMEPTIRPGDLVAIRPTPVEQLHVGDVITFQPRPGDPTLITHRIVRIQLGAATGTVVVTRGDANGADDPPIIPAQVKGKVVYHLPYAGRLTLLAGDHRRDIVVAVALGLFGYAAFQIGRPGPARRGRKEES